MILPMRGKNEKHICFFSGSAWMSQDSLEMGRYNLVINGPMGYIGVITHLFLTSWDIYSGVDDA